MTCIHLTCDCDRGHSVPDILCSHPQGLPCPNFKLLIFARTLLQRKMKIAVHMHGEESCQLHCPDMLELKSLHNVHNSMGDTAVHTDSSTRSRKTKSHNWKQLFLSVVYGQVARKSCHPKSSCPKPESFRAKFIVISPDILSHVARNFMRRF